MTVAYLVNQYPAVSHTFIRREIAALERLGLEVTRIAIRGPKAGVLSPEDQAEADKTQRIVGAPVADLLRAMLACFLARPLGVLGMVSHALRLGVTSEAGVLRHLFYAAEALVAAEWLKAAGVRHVHAHFGTNSATVAMLAAPLADARFSVTVHGPEEFDKPGAIHLPEKIERADFVAGVSSFGLAQLRRIVPPAQWGKLKIIRCGIEKEFYTGESQVERAPHRLLSVGRLSEQKGQLTLLEAAAILHRKGVAFELAIVGDGDMRADLERFIAEHNLGERVALLGWKTPSEVRAEIERATAFVLPSYAEGLPVSIMEAFSLETPVISTYIAGIPELVENGVNGWLTPAGDAEALADAMAAALQTDPPRRAAMGAEGKARVLARHDIDKEAALLAEAFRKGAERPATQLADGAGEAQPCP